jgi:hypothetical protein
VPWEPGQTWPRQVIPFCFRKLLAYAGRLSVRMRPSWACKPAQYACSPHGFSSQKKDVDSLFLLACRGLLHHAIRPLWPTPLDHRTARLPLTFSNTGVAHRAAQPLGVVASTAGDRTRTPYHRELHSRSPGPRSCVPVGIPLRHSAASSSALMSLHSSKKQVNVALESACCKRIFQVLF